MSRLRRLIGWFLIVATTLAIQLPLSATPFEQKIYRPLTFWGNLLRKPVQIYNVKLVNATHDTATFEWETNRPASSWAFVPTKEAATVSNGGVGEPTEKHRVTVRGLHPGQPNTAELYSASDAWETSVMVQFNTASLIISDIRTKDLSDNAATIVWKTNQPARSWVVFPPTAWNTQRVLGSNEETMDHEVKVTELEPGREYVVEVRSGNSETVSEPYSFTTTGGTSQARPGPNPPDAPSVAQPVAPVPETLAISAPQVKDVSESSAVFEWKTNRPANSWVRVDISGAVSGQNDSKLDHRVALYGLTPGYTYTVQLRSGDGTAVVTQSVTFTTKHGKWEPLQIISPEVSEVTDTNATITWRTNLPANSWVHAGLRIRQGPVFGLNDSVTDHRVTLTGLSPGQTYIAEVRSGNGKDIATSIVTFTSMAKPPAALSITSAEKLNVTGLQATFVWTTSEPSDSWVQLRGQGNPVGQSESVRRHEVTVTGLMPGQTYVAELRSSNGGNTATVAIPFKANDMTPITIIQARPTWITDTTATILWSTNYRGNSWVQIPPGEGGKTFGQNDYTDFHQVALTGLSPNTDYAAEIRSNDITGVARTVIHFRTNPTGVLTPNGISIRGAEVIKTTQTTATIKWTTSGPANTWVKMEDGVFGRNDSSTDHEVIVTGLKAGQSYAAEVRSRGDTGDAVSMLVTFRTLPDVLTITDFEVVDISSSGATIVWNTNRPANSWVHIPPRSQGGPAFGANESVLEHRVEIKNLQPGTMHTAELRSRDDTGEVTSVVITFPTR